MSLIHSIKLMWRDRLCTQDQDLDKQFGILSANHQLFKLIGHVWKRQRMTIMYLTIMFTMPTQTSSHDSRQCIGD